MEASTADATAQDQSPQQMLARILAEQNFALAIPAGLGAAVVGAVLWAIVVFVTEMQIGLVAVAVGAMVGYAVKLAGKGVERKFGILGAACAAFGWVLGTFLCVVAFMAHASHVGVTDVLLRVGLQRIAAVSVDATRPFDLVFLAIAVYEGYKFSFRARLVRRPAPSARH